MSTKIPATEGHPYVVAADGHGYYLHRRSVKGADHSIHMTRANALAVANALVGLIESHAEPCTAPA